MTQPPTPRTRPRFKYAPVAELVCGTLFNSLPKLSAPMIGVYWNGIRDTFKHVEVVAPLAPAIEQFGEGQPPQQLQFSDVPPPPRTWMLTEDRSRLVQIQQDRFLYNWKRESDTSDYPSYDVVFAEFLVQFETFRTFLRTENIGATALRQYELTYVNHIFASSLTTIEGGLEGVLVDHLPNRSGSRALPAPEGILWRSIYTLPESSGRLHITAQNAKRTTDGAPLLRLDLTARGFSGDGSDSTMKAWFGMAHDNVGRAFRDVTSTRVQNEIWRLEP